MSHEKLARAIIYHAGKTKRENLYCPGIPDAQSEVCVDPFLKRKLRSFFTLR